MNSYKKAVDTIIHKGKSEELKSLWLPLEGLHNVCKFLFPLVDWLIIPKLETIEDPENSQNLQVSNVITSQFTSYSAPLAFISMEEDLEGIRYDPIIYFFDKRVQTVGVLLHELAHIKYMGHEPEFYEILKQLLDIWNTTFTYQKISEGILK